MYVIYTGQKQKRLFPSKNDTSDMKVVLFSFWTVYIHAGKYNSIILFNFFDPTGCPTLILIKIKISMGQPAGSTKVNNTRNYELFYWFY